MINYFIGWTKTELEVSLREAQEALAAGQTVMRVNTKAGSGGNETEGQIEVPVKSRIEMLYYALSILDSTTYPPASTRRVNRTQVEVYPYWANGAALQ